MKKSVFKKLFFNTLFSRFSITGTLLFVCIELKAQTNPLEVDGYFKSLSGFSAVKGLENILLSGNIQNRIRMKYTLSDQQTFRIEIRNRLLWGDYFLLFPELLESIGDDPSFLDLSFHHILKTNLVLNSNIDRCVWKLDWKEWSISFGRQRIHWGIHNHWNPNDLFNTQDFLDFDYPERPGTDAIRVQRTTGLESGFDIAFHPEKKIVDATTGIRYFTQINSYDVQGILGMYKGELALGAGWAGAIGSSGWKTECTFFGGKKIRGHEEKPSWTLTTSWDHMFKGQWYTSMSILYHSLYVSSNALFGFSPSLVLSPKQLFPSQFSVMLQGSKIFWDRLNVQMALLYGTENDLLLVYPGFSWDVGNQSTFDFRSQLAWANLNHEYSLSIQNHYLAFQINF